MKITILTLVLFLISAVSFAQAPTTAAPTPPQRDSADVISIFSDAYDDITVDTFSADFDDSDIEDVTIDGNATKKITFTNFIAVDFQSNKQDMSEMTHFHMDFWIGESNLDGKVFNSKFSHWGGTDEEVSAFELNLNTGTNPPIDSGRWVSVDVEISSFSNTPGARDDVAQFLITSNLSEAYVDNIYVYKATATSNENESLPTEFSLDQNYPNPFNPSTNISFSLPQAEQVTIKVYDMLGREIATLANRQTFSAGSNQITFDAANLSSGIYIYRLQTSSVSLTRKMTLIK